jgi:hypothetical protein
MNKQLNSLIHLGCSWSRAGAQGNGDLGVPECLSTHLPNTTYYTSSVGGGDQYSQIEILKLMIEKVDLVIFQMTSTYRWSVRIGHNTDISWESFFNKNVLKCEEWLRQNFVYWNPNYEACIDHFFYGEEKWKKLAEQIYLHDFHAEQMFFNSVAGIRKICEIYNKPLILYGHRKDAFSGEFLKNNLEEILDFITFEEFGGEDEAMKYVIDNGHHFGTRGNKIVAEQLLLPRIKKLFT